MRRKCGKHLGAEISVIITICNRRVDEMFSKTFRNVCPHKYALDPAHNYSSPGLSWDALLKQTGVELELLTDQDMHLFTERGMRGGILMPSKRYAQANNPLVEYDPSKQSLRLDDESAVPSTCGI